MPILSGAAISERLGRGGSVWVLSDVHANLDAFDAVLALVPEDAGLVLLGDLLTYGCRPGEVMARVSELVKRRDVALLLGNHDQLYIDLLSGERTYYEKMPAWIRETVDWTLERVDPHWWNEELGWREKLAAGHILFDHANPEPYGDWKYINTRAEHKAAIETLVEQGYRVGVFGHTHRPKCLHQSALGERYLERGVELIVQEGERAILNAGSVGQPRGSSQRATALEIAPANIGLSLRHHAVEYDLDSHLTAIRKSTLSTATRAKLCSFFSDGSRA